MEENVNIVEAQLTSYLEENYSPTISYLEADVRMNTHELYSKIQAMFPIEGFSQYSLFNLLLKLGFRYHDSGDLTPEWLFIHVKK